MAKVQITTALTAKLLQPGSLLSPSLLIQQFSYWIDNGVYSNAMFASTTKTENCLSHTHMAPGNPVDLAAWVHHHRKGHWGQLKSDRCLLWAFDPTHGQLLIDVLFDPGAHQLWTPPFKNVLKNLQTVADNFQFANAVP